MCARTCMRGKCEKRKREREVTLIYHMMQGRNTLSSVEACVTGDSQRQGHEQACQEGRSQRGGDAGNVYGSPRIADDK